MAHSIAGGGMLPDYDVLFADHAEKYDRFVAAEDYRGNLLRTLKQVGRLNREQAVADLGTGTGRVAFLVCPIVRHVYGVEPVGGMRLVANTKKQTLGIKNVDFLPGEHKDIPLPDNSIDLVVEGWAFLKAFHTVYPEWRPEFDVIVSEMKRILRPNGIVVLIETMGSLHIWNEVPTEHVELYDYFEKELHLKRSVVRTDYKFASSEEAVDFCSFFFGDEIGTEVSKRGDSIVPEATALWHGRL
jgi:ubiquinone/menaquinone biosynthesis C-methylase UbiE